MYLINEFVYGYDLNDDIELKKLISNFDLEYYKIINNKSYELSSPYNGDCIGIKNCPLLLGVVITTNEFNDNFLKEVRNAKEEDYIDSFNKFVDYLKYRIIEDKNKYLKKYENEILMIIDKLNKLKPKFYMIETTS